MATKQQVQSKAAKANCKFEVEGNYVDLYAPRGYSFWGESHIVLREASSGYLTKADIYEEMFDALDDLRPCGPECLECG